MGGRETKRIAAALAALRDADDALDRLDAARVIRETAERLESLSVADARKAGHSWSEIGEVYQLTKQGAQQRFGTSQASGARKRAR